MSFDKAIEHGKEKRKPYYGMPMYFLQCRNHGMCPFCRSDRTHKMIDKYMIGCTIDDLLISYETEEDMAQ